MLDLGCLHTDFETVFENAHAVDVELEECKARLSRLQAHIASLSMFRNSFAPITRLPVELLERIFLELAAPYQRPSSDHDFAFGSDTIERTPTCIGRVTTVCRRWREVALRCPRLWTHLPEVLPEEDSDRFILRSKDAPLTVYHRLDDLPEDIYSTYSLIFEQRHRLHHLYGIFIQEGELNRYLTCSGLHGQDIDFPLLESLQITFDIATWGNLSRVYAPKPKRLMSRWSSFEPLQLSGRDRCTSKCHRSRPMGGRSECSVEIPINGFFGRFTRKKNRITRNRTRDLAFSHGPPLPLRHKRFAIHACPMYMVGNAIQCLQHLCGCEHGRPSRATDSGAIARERYRARPMHVHVAHCSAPPTWARGSPESRR